MSLTDPTANVAVLYSILTKESFGNTASRIVELLCTRESCTLPEIVSRLNLRTREVVRELQLLIRSKLVIADSGSAIVFRAHVENLERLSRHAHFDRLVETALRSRSASRIVRYLLIFGTLRILEILARCFDEMDEDANQQTNEAETSKKKADQEREILSRKVDVVRQLTKLCQIGIIRGRVSENNPAPAAVATSARVVAQNETVRQLLAGAPNNFNALVREVDARRQRNASGRESGETVSNGFLELDFDVLDRLVIEDFCVEAIRVRFGEFSAELVRAMFAESRNKSGESNLTSAPATSSSGYRNNQEIESNYPLEQVWMRVDEFASSRARYDGDSVASSRVDWSTVSDEVKRAHLDAIVNDSAGFVDSDALGALSNGQTRYTIRVQKMVERLVDRAVERVIEQRDGARAARVYRCVRSIEYADLKEIESTCLLSAKEAKELAFKLLADHFIRLTELSRSGNFVSSQSLFLLRAEPMAVVRRITELASRTLHNLIAKRILILDENSALFEAQKRIEADLAALQNEYRDALRKIQEQAVTSDHGERNEDEEPSMTVEELDAIQAERSTEIRSRLCDADRVRLESAKCAVATLRNGEMRIAEQLFLLGTHTRMSIAAQRIVQRSLRAAGSTRRRTAATAGTDIVQQLAAASASAPGAKRRTTATTFDDEAAGASDGKRRRKT